MTGSEASSANDPDHSNDNTGTGTGQVPPQPAPTMTSTTNTAQADSEPAENAAVMIADRMQLSTSSSAKRMKNALKNCMATSAKQKIKAVENPPL